MTGKLTIRPAEAGASTYHLPGSTFRAQAIDPKTGEILWEQQMISGAAAATVVAANGANPVMCRVDAETGNVSLDAGQTDAFLAITDPPNASGWQVAQTVEGDGLTVSIGVFTDPAEQPIAAAIDDGEVYLQLADGSLVKVDAGQNSGEAGHQEEADDDSQGGTAESDDHDKGGTAESDDDDNGGTTESDDD